MDYKALGYELLEQEITPYFLYNNKALRAGTHCGGVETCCRRQPAAGENPAKQDSFLLQFFTKKEILWIDNEMEKGVK